MSFRLYVVPIVGTGTRTDSRRPKYFQSDLTGAGTGTVLTSGESWSAMDFGNEPVMVVGADLSVSDDNLIIGQADVIALPVDLSPVLSGAQVTAIKAQLEALHIPAGWVTTTLTWLQVVRTVLGMFAFLQRYAAIYSQQNGVVAPSLFQGVTLNTLFGSLPALIQTAIIATATSFGISTSGLTATTPLRAILKALSDNFQSKQWDFNGTLI